MQLINTKERLCSTHAESSHEKVHARQNDVRKDDKWMGVKMQVHEEETGNIDKKSGSMN